MKKKYTKQELSKYVLSIVHNEFANAQFLYEQFQDTLNTHVNILFGKEIEQSDLQKWGYKLAKDAITNFDRIKLQQVEEKLKSKLIEESAQNGIRLNEKAEYLRSVARALIAALLAKRLVELKHRKANGKLEPKSLLGFALFKFKF